MAKRGAPAAEWRSRFRWVGWVMLVLYASGAAVSAALVLPNQGTDRANALWSLVLFAPLAVGAYAGLVRPVIRSLDGGLLIRNPIRTRFIPWQEVEKISPSRSGLVFRLRGGQRVTGWAVQQSAFRTALNRRCRADDVAEFLGRRAAHHQGRTPASLRPSDQERRSRVGAARATLGLAVLLTLTYVLTHRW